MDEEAIENLLQYWEEEVKHMETRVADAYQDRDNTNIRLNRTNALMFDLQKEYRKLKTIVDRQNREIRRLVYHENLTVGLWATDRPDLVPPEFKELFREITPVTTYPEEVPNG